MIVPFSKSPSGLAQAPDVSETDLLMALATMHQQGKLKKPPPPEPKDA